MTASLSLPNRHPIVLIGRIQSHSWIDSKGSYWDTLEAYHYVRLSFEEDLLIVGGEDHKTGQKKDPELCFQKIENWARARFACGEVAYRWSGQVIEPYDCLAYCGRNPNDFENVYVTQEAPEMESPTVR